MRENAAYLLRKQNPTLRGIGTECEEAAKRIEELEGDSARKDDLLAAAVEDYNNAKALADRLKLEAQMHAGEARAANSTIYEIYQALSGGKGEPGNWHGATPAIEYVASVKDLLSEAEKFLTDLRSCVNGEGPYSRGSDSDTLDALYGDALVLSNKIREATK